MKRYKVPDHFRRGLRQAIGVGTAVFVGYLLLHGDHLLALYLSMHASTAFNYLFGLRTPSVHYAYDSFAYPLGATLCKPSLLAPWCWCCASSAGVKEQYAKQWLQGAKWAAITIVVVGSPVLGKVTQARLCTGWEASAGEKLLVMSRWYQPARLCTPGAVAGLLCLNESPLGCRAIQACHRLHSVECAESVKATSMALAACLHLQHTCALPGG